MAIRAYSGVILILAAISVIRSSSCPTGWTSDFLSMAPRCLYFVPTEATFQDAKSACEHLGGSLVAPLSLLDTAGVTNFIQTEVAEELQRDVWLDMVKVDGKWQTSDGSQVEHTAAWYHGYPEGSGTCTVLLYSRGLLKNRDCDLTMSFICSGSPDSVEEITSTCTTGPDLPPLTSISELAGPPIVGSVVYLQCEEELSLSDFGHIQSMCAHSGEWTNAGSLAQCQVSSCSGLQLGMSVVEVSNGGTEVGAVRNFTCGEGAEFLTINTSYTVVRCEANGDWVTYTGERVDNSIEGCIKTQPEYDGNDVVGDGGLNKAGSHPFITCNAVISLALTVPLMR